jgi:hypothetical protein
VPVALSSKRFKRGDVHGYACSGVDPIDLGGVHNRRSSADGITKQAVQTVQKTVKGLDG